MSAATVGESQKSLTNSADLSRSRISVESYGSNSSGLTASGECIVLSCLARVVRKLYEICLVFGDD